MQDELLNVAQLKSISPSPLNVINKRNLVIYFPTSILVSKIR